MVTPAVTLRVFVWIRVVGMLVGCLAFYYLRASYAALDSFIVWTVPARLSVILFFGAFVAFGLAPAALILFGVVDALAAPWTWRALRRSPRRA